MTQAHAIFGDVFADQGALVESPYRNYRLGILATVAGYALMSTGACLLFGSTILDARVWWGFFVSLIPGIPCEMAYRRFKLNKQVMFRIGIAYSIGSLILVDWWIQLRHEAIAWHVIGFTVLWFGVVLLKAGPKLCSVSAMELLEQDTRPPVLYLRRFAQDERDNTAQDTAETLLVETMSAYGPVVAIGQPNERLQVVGAARVYVTVRDDESWKLIIERLMKVAAFVVLRIGPLFEEEQPESIENWRKVSGYAWEVYSALKLVPPGKLLLHEPASVGLGSKRKSRRSYERFREQCSHFLNRTMPPRLGKSPFVAFSADGTARLLGSSPGLVTRAIAAQQPTPRVLLRSALKELNLTADEADTPPARPYIRQWLTWRWHVRNLLFLLVVWQMLAPVIERDPPFHWHIRVALCGATFFAAAVIQLWFTQTRHITAS